MRLFVMMLLLCTFGAMGNPSTSLNSLVPADISISQNKITLTNLVAGSAMVTILTAQGREVSRQTLSVSSSTLSFSPNLPAGMYVVRLQNGMLFSSHKILLR